MKKKIGLLCLIGVLCVNTFAACQKPAADTSSSPVSSEQTQEKDEYTFQEREIKMKGQTYTGSGVVYPDELWETPEYEYCSDLDFGGVGDVKGFFMTSPITYNGKKTKIAGYIGFPEGASATNKVPSIVLVHGGLGTAIPDWVKYWNDLGFAAISIDTEGGEPVQGVSNFNNVHNEENRYKGDATYTNGPTNQGFSDFDKDNLNKQWYYHASSAVILANSLMASFDCVDTQKMGITGISWGGMLTSTVIGYDDRFSFAIPVYGCSSLVGSGGSMATVYGVNGAAEMWDTTEGLKQSNCKVFYINSMKDPFFSMDANSRCAMAANGFLLLKSVFPHGQEYGALEANIPFFAKYFCGMKSEYLEIVQHPTLENPAVAWRKYGKVTVDLVELVYTTEEKINTRTEWKRETLSLDTKYDSHILTLPTEAKHVFVHITYNGNLEVSAYVIG